MSADVREVTLALLARRATGATICPSEVARAIASEAGGKDWRGEMAAVHAAAEAMAAEGLVALSWRAAKAGRRTLQDRRWDK